MTLRSPSTSYRQEDYRHGTFPWFLFWVFLEMGLLVYHGMLPIHMATGIAASATMPPECERTTRYPSFCGIMRFGTNMTMSGTKVMSISTTIMTT